MKIAIPSSGPESGDRIDDRFGRAPYFIIYDQDKDTIETCRNDVAGASGGVGPKAAQILIQRGIDVVVTGRVGGNALESLKSGGIKVYLYEGRGTVTEALSAFLAGGLKEQ
jgi:predicted Fe-Mo cluster-binding NifX family protein